MPETSSDFQLDSTLIALADPTRRAILQRLSGGEARVTEIAKPFKISLNAVSKHLRMLERAKLIHRRRQGREHFLSLQPEPLNEAATWMREQRQLWSQRLEQLDQILKAEDAANYGDPTPVPAPSGRS